MQGNDPFTSLIHNVKVRTRSRSNPLVLRRKFGWELQNQLQSHLKDQHDGELPVGQAAIVETRDATIPFLISAPTMRVPMSVSNTLNAYLAFRAAIRAVRQHNTENNRLIRSVLCPGLCTAIGRMPPRLAAKQMATAYRTCVLGHAIEPSSHWTLLGDRSDR